MVVPVLAGIASSDLAPIATGDKASGKVLNLSWPAFPTDLFVIVNQMDRLISGLFSTAGLPLDTAVRISGPPLRLKSPEQAIVELLSMFSTLEAQLPRLQSAVEGRFLGGQ